MNRRSTKWLFLMVILVALRDLFVQCFVPFLSHFRRIMDPFVHMLDIYHLILPIILWNTRAEKLTILPIIEEIDGLFS